MREPCLTTEARSLLLACALGLLLAAGGASCKKKPAGESSGAEPPKPTISLLKAVEGGNLDEVRSNLHWTPASVNQVDGDPGYELSPLVAAARSGRLDIVQMLVKGGADVRKGVYWDRPGYTALHGAANADHLDVVKFLVEAGADPNAVAVFPDGSAATRPIDYAADPQVRSYLEGVR